MFYCQTFIKTTIDLIFTDKILYTRTNIHLHTHIVRVCPLPNTDLVGDLCVVNNFKNILKQYI